MMSARYDNDAYGLVTARSPLLLILLCLALFLPGFFSLPPVDRDEARFAQASRQMLETHDFVDIRFQNEGRHKKPVGIYWLQAASAALFGADRIWAYRLPSLLGAIAAVLLTFALGSRLFAPPIGFAAAALLACSLLLNVEARQAKTDAMLLGASAYLTKPVSYETLLQTVARLLGKPQSA